MGSIGPAELVVILAIGSLLLLVPVVVAIVMARDPKRPKRPIRCRRCKQMMSPGFASCPQCGEPTVATLR